MAEQVSVSSPQPPAGLLASHGQLTDDTSRWSASTRTASRFYRGMCGRKIDKQLCVFLMAGLFTLLVLAFCVEQIARNADPEHFSTYISFITFTLGVWVGQLPGMQVSTRQSSQEVNGSVPSAPDIV